MENLAKCMLLYGVLFLRTSAAAVGADNFSLESLQCKSMPGDASWPSLSSWAQLNSSVSGRLIATEPIASVCHDPYFDVEACNLLKNENAWAFINPHIRSPSDIVSPYFQNQSCDPYTPRQKACVLGNYPSYSINVSDIQDIQAGIRFARDKNIRLNIKNTGHDILGKSTGAGSISLWVHNMKKMQFFNHCNVGSEYAGPCAKFQTGVTLGEAYDAADSRGFRLTGGTCPTVALGGGFALGGGHGVLTSRYGLGADNVLEWEVVTAGGIHLFANTHNNSDLYWALSGGGGGTFAVVVSMTMRIHEDEAMTAGGFSFTNITVGGTEKFWQGVAAFYKSLLHVVKTGATASFLINPTALTVFNIAIPDANTTRASSTIQGIKSHMARSGISINISSSSHPGFLSMYDTYLRPIAINTPAAQMAAGRFIPRALIEDAKKSPQIIEALRLAVESGFNVICVALDASKAPPHRNSVAPAWRSSLMTCLIQKSWDFTATWEKNLFDQDVLNKHIMPRIEVSTPQAGAYLNEASFEQTDWQETFYGSNYKRLNAVKIKYDPQHLLYAATAVGSEFWRIRADGRLCRA